MDSTMVKKTLLLLSLSLGKQHSRNVYKVAVFTRVGHCCLWFPSVSVAGCSSRGAMQLVGGQMMPYSQPITARCSLPPEKGTRGQLAPTIAPTAPSVGRPRLVRSVKEEAAPKKQRKRARERARAGRANPDFQQWGSASRGALHLF